MSRYQIFFVFMHTELSKTITHQSVTRGPKLHKFNNLLIFPPRVSPYLSLNVPIEQNKKCNKVLWYICMLGSLARFFVLVFSFCLDFFFLEVYANWGQKGESLSLPARKDNYSDKG